MTTDVVHRLYSKVLQYCDVSDVVTTSCTLLFIVLMFWIITLILALLVPDYYVNMSQRELTWCVMDGHVTRKALRLEVEEESIWFEQR